MARLIRTFIAIEMPSDLRGRAGRLQQTLAESGAAVRWVAQENIHLTLKFLGDIEDVQIPAVCRAVERVTGASEAFELEVACVGAFPNAERPRTLWLGVKGGSEMLIALHERLDAALEELGYRPEERRFSPHVTLGRLRNGRDSHRLAAAMAPKADWMAGTVTVAETVVMASELTPQGPRYSVMGRGRLGASRSGEVLDRLS